MHITQRKLKNSKLSTPNPVEVYINSTRRFHFTREKYLRSQNRNGHPIADRSATAHLTEPSPIAAVNIDLPPAPTRTNSPGGANAMPAEKLRKIRWPAAKSELKVQGEPARAHSHVSARPPTARPFPFARPLPGLLLRLPPAAVALFPRSPRVMGKTDALPSSAA